jgi:hypothetical protein
MIGYLGLFENWLYTKKSDFFMRTMKQAGFSVPDLQIPRSKNLRLNVFRHVFFCLTLEISPASKFSPGGVFYNFAQDGISSLNGQSRLN